MFNGIEVILGIICSILGIALGYVTILGVIVGIRLVVRRSIEKSEDITKNLDAGKILH